MAFSMKNISGAIEKHPVMASIIFGSAALLATIIITKKSSGSKQNTAQQVCTDAAGNMIDCTTGAPIGTGTGFALQSTGSGNNGGSNDNSALQSAIDALTKMIQALMDSLKNTGNGGGNGGGDTQKQPPGSQPPIHFDPGSDGVGIGPIPGRIINGITGINPFPVLSGNNDAWQNNQIPVPAPVGQGGIVPAGSGVNNFEMLNVFQRASMVQHSSSQNPWDSTLWGIANQHSDNAHIVMGLNPHLKNPVLLKRGQKVYY